MAIVQCPVCEKRISSVAPSCPHCHAALGELGAEARQRLRLRRWQDRMYRMRNLSYVAMAMVLVGVSVWWMAPPEGLALPVPPLAILVLAPGVVLYVVARGWLSWIRLREDPRRSRSSGRSGR
ncbi:MAG: hypothetical protein RQ729_01455 [Wenzhouxiangellaceae bacterium]|nr:hypothetical protein [Wenzhouxiangellaceae bacterium]